MLSHKVLTRQDIGRAASYYEDGADDYYAKEGDASAWQGRGAAALGLTGTVDSNRFRELLAGRVPHLLGVEQQAVEVEEDAVDHRAR
jgi:conjugative relaxase-like TrwC/TraI family protein